MNIPKKFNLCALTIDVVEDNDLATTKHIIGESRYTRQQVAYDTTAAPAETIEQTFWHEAIHWCFYIMGEDELRNNEKIVDMLGHLVYQIVKTGGYVIEKKYLE